MLTLIFVLFLLVIAAQATSTVVSSYDASNASETEVWAQVQSYKARTSKPYIYDQTACEYANSRLEDIKESFNHNKFRITSKDFMDAHSLRGIGENLYERPRLMFIRYAALEEWLKSPSHKTNLDDPDFTHSCIKCDSFGCVQIFTSY